MRQWAPDQVARAAGARLCVSGSAQGPDRVTIDSRDAGPGALFVGLPGGTFDGGDFAEQALAAGAWGVLVSPAFGDAAVSWADAGQAVLTADAPLVALQWLARAWRRALGATVIGVTGSTGKTTTKELLAAMLAPHRRTTASRANFNTEIGLPLEILSAPEGTEVLVLEMAMRGAGQIAELCEIAEPDAGVIVSIGPVHLELLGTIEAIAAAKAELLAALPSGGVAVVPARERLLDPHLRADLRTITFGPGGQVTVVAVNEDRLAIDLDGSAVEFDVQLSRQPHVQLDLLAAAAAAAAIGAPVGGELAFVASAGRGRHLEVGRVTVIDGSYNANPMSMAAGLAELDSTAAAHSPRGRRVAVLGDMLELGDSAATYHRELGRQASTQVDLLVTVGSHAAEAGREFTGEHRHVSDARAAAELVPSLLADGDVVLVKGSYGVGLRAVVERLEAGAPA